MARSQHTGKGERCDKVLKAVGDYWTLALIEVLGSGEKRFCELERAIPTINPVTLTARLKAMEGLGLIKRWTDSEKKIPVIYGLTDEGEELLPITVSIRKFAEEFTPKKS